MADEPRRSGRSTKGQHKNLDMVNETPGKKSKLKAHAKDKGSKASAEPTPGPSEEEGEDEIIRCICGEYEEEEDIERDMICCDECSAWQHNDCMGLKFAKGQEPDQYFCEQCRPENHKDLLERMARGEKPWEEVAERRRREAEELKQSKRKGRKKGGKRGRPSESKADASTPARGSASRPSATPSETPAASTATPVAEKSTHPPDQRSASSQKRKFSEQQEVSTPESGPKSKQQKISPAARGSTPQTKSAPVKRETASQDAQQPSVTDTATTQGAKSFDDISIPARRNAASALAKVFVDQISDALARGSFKLPQGKAGEDVGQQLGLSVEDALYQNLCGGSGEPTEAYKLQLRTILFNVKKNPSLRDRLLVGSLLPEDLSKMSSQDMASEELQQKDAEIKREAERQHIIIQEQGPRIRRTHKGEEIVEDDQQNVASEPVFSAAPPRAAAEDGSPAAHSPTSPVAKQSETAAQDKPPQTQEAKPTERTNHDEHFPPRSHSPGTGHEQVFPEVATNIREPIPTGKVQADAEIDQLLKDDDEPDSPPYSPKEHHEEGSIWHGKVVMNPVSEFMSFAKHVGGADLSGRIPWNELIPPTLLIDGRIDIQLATNYLCGLRFSSSTDVSVISVSSPESPKEKAGFDKLFNYFQDRKRYGVIGKHPLPAVKDTYLIPIEAGSKKKPEFIELLENNALEDPTPERILLVVFAVKMGESNPPSVQPPSHHSSMEPAASASPLTVASGTPQQANFATPGPRAAAQFPPTPSPAFPGAPQGSIPYNQQTQQPNAAYNSFQAQPPTDQPSVTGLAAAIQVLGGQANTPAIQQLLQQAPNANITQLNVVRDILVRQPQAASDYQLLMNELYHATTTNGNGHTPQQPAQ